MHFAEQVLWKILKLVTHFVRRTPCALARFVLNNLPIWAIPSDILIFAALVAENAGRSTRARNILAHPTFRRALKNAATSSSTAVTMKAALRYAWAAIQTRESTFAVMLYRKAGQKSTEECSEILYNAGCELYRMGFLSDAKALLLESVDAAFHCANYSTQRECPAMYLWSDEWTKNFGHIALLDTYFKLKVLGELPNSSSVLLIENKADVANAYFLGLFKEHLGTENDPGKVKTLHQASRNSREYFNVIRSKDGRGLHIFDAFHRAESQWALKKSSPLIRMPIEDVDRCIQVLHNGGIPAGSWFVTVQVRGGRFKHEPQSFSPRNAIAGTYVRAIRAIRERGGYVVWMGEDTRLIPGIENLVFNYSASSSRSEMMDVYLLSCCRFFVGVGSGVSQAPGVFGVPTVFTNYVPICARMWRQADLGIPKLIRNCIADKFLTWEEQIQPSIGLLESNPDLRRLGLEVVDNSASDIEQVIFEMMDKLDIASTLAPTPLQIMTHEIAAKYNCGTLGSIGARFLEEHAKKLGLDCSNSHNYNR